jgi:hypothetical protein
MADEPEPSPSEAAPSSPDSVQIETPQMTRGARIDPADGTIAEAAPLGRGLHSSTFQLNLSQI